MIQIIDYFQYLDIVETRLSAQQCLQQHFGLLVQHFGYIYVYRDQMYAFLMQFSIDCIIVGFCCLFLQYCHCVYQWNCGRNRKHIFKIIQGNGKFFTIGENGFAILTLFCLSPVLPFSHGNYKSYLTSVHFIPYVLRSWMTILP